MSKPALNTKSAVRKEPSTVAGGAKPLGPKEIESRLPPGLPARQSVVALLVAARLPNPSVMPAAAACLVEIIRSNSWLLGYFAADELYETISSLSSVAGSMTRQNMVTFGQAHAEDFYTVVGKSNPLPQAENLRAVYLLAHHRYRTDSPSTRMSKKEIATLGEFIRKLEHRSGKLLGADALDSVASATDLNEIGATASVDLADKKSVFATDWRTRWMPWIQRLSSDTRRPDRVNPDPADISPRALSWKTPDDDEGGEPGLDLRPITKPTQTGKSQIPPSASFAAAFADQSLRSKNLDLSKDHVGVATDAEIRVVIQRCRHLLKLSGQETGLDLAPCLLLLEIVTGRQLAPLADAYIRPASPPDEGRHLILDLKRGLLIQPVLIPEHIRRPPPEDEELFDANTYAIELPLPELLLSLLQRLYRWRRVDRLIHWLDGIDPESMIRSFLRSIHELEGRGRPSSAPYRRWFGCQVQEVGGDIAKTMLLAGDNFGRSTAPLYYTSPCAHELLVLYRNALEGFFDMPLFESSNKQQRVGPASITKLSVAQAGISQISKRLNVSPAKAIADRDKALRYHNAFTHYLSHYIAIITSHRPTKALYALTRRQFDLRHHFAVIQDKNSDPEHFTRLVATTPSLSECIANYLAHLHALCSCWGTAESLAMVEDIRHGNAPMLQYLTDNGELRSGTTEDLRSGTAEAWLRLPANWYRPLQSMYLREHGAQPLAVLGHVGHLEAASHPFLSESVLSPLEVVEAVRPSVIGMEKELGFRVISGFGLTRQLVNPPAIHDWQSDLHIHEVRYRAIVKDQAGLVRAKLKANRRAAAEWLLESIGAINPALLKIVNAIRLRRLNRLASKLDSALVRLTIPDDDIVKLLALNETTHQNNDPLRIATHNLLCRWLRSAVADAETKVLDIGLINLSPRAELSPLLQHNCTATEQIGALRDWFQNQCHVRGKFPPQLLRVFALVLYEGLRDALEILALSTTQEIASAFTGRGSALCSVVPGRRGPVTITGVPALALSTPLPKGALAQSLGELSRQLADILPAHFVPSDPQTTLDYWATTAQIASRIEQAGLFRYAASPEGILEAPVAQQAAFFIKQFPADTPRAAQDTPDNCAVTLDVQGVDPQHAMRDGLVAPGVTKPLIRRYKRVLLALDDPAQIFSDFKRPLPLGISPSEQGNLGSILDALNLCEPDVDSQSPLDIVSALATFARDLCVNGTRLKSTPAVNTVQTYVSTIGRDLLDVFGDVDLRTLFEEDFEAAYELFKQSSQRQKSGARASMVLADFHLLLVNSYGLPEVETPWLCGNATNTDQRPAPVLLTEAQYLAARQYLIEQVNMSAKHSFAETTWRRLASAALVALILMRRSGARISEDALSRLADVWRVDGSIFMVIRPSPFRKLKTAAATRRVDLTTRLDEKERSFVEAWLRSEKEVHGAGDRKTLMFPVLGRPDQAIGVPLIRQIIQMAFRRGAGIEMHPHLIRHLWLTEATDEAANQAVSPTDLTQRIRRFETIRLGIGHTRLSTGTASYVHTRLAVGRLSQRMLGAPRLDRWLLSTFSSKRVENVDKVRQRYCNADTSNLQCLWTDVLFASNSDVDWTTASKDPPPALLKGAVSHKALSISNLDRYVRMLRLSADPSKLAGSFGFSRPMTDEIGEAINAVARAPIFYRLLAAKTRRGNVRAEPLPRDLDGELLVKLYECATPDRCHQAARLFRQTYTPSAARLDCFMGTEDHLNELQELLIFLGVPTQSFAREPGQLKVRVDGKKVGLFHSLAWSLAILTLVSTLTPGTYRA